MSERFRVGRILTATTLIFTAAVSTFSKGPDPDRYQIHLSPGKCDSSLWESVHDPLRLKILNPCITVSGTIREIEPEDDGDMHVLLRLDAEFKDIENSLLFNGNVTYLDGNLMTEPIPVHGVLQPFQIKVGEHVEITGSFVSDTWHHGWLEIHPITQVVVK